MLDNVLEGCNFMMPYIGISHWLLGEVMYGEKMHSCQNGYYMEPNLEKVDFILWS